MSAETRVLEVIGAQVALLIADAELVGHLGGQHVYERMSEDRITQVPGVYWYTLPLTLEENEESCVVRWDIYSNGTAEGFLIEGCLRRLLHYEYPASFGGVVSFSQLVQSIDVTEGIMGQDDQAHRVVEIQIKPVRQRART
jgi:hypothetical protein